MCNYIRGEKEKTTPTPCVHKRITRIGPVFRKKYHTSMNSRSEKNSSAIPTFFHPCYMPTPCSLPHALLHRLRRRLRRRGRRSVRHLLLLLLLHLLLLHLLLLHGKHVLLLLCGILAHGARENWPKRRAWQSPRNQHIKMNSKTHTHTYTHTHTHTHTQIYIYIYSHKYGIHTH